MPNELDSIAWEKLDHAYGPAGNIPALIRDLVNQNHEVVESALNELFSNIWHQGTVYPASAPAVQHLVQVLPKMLPKHQAELLSLLSCLAQGHGYYDVHRHLPAIKEAMEKSWVDDADATLELERCVVKNTTLAVFAHWDEFEGYLDVADQNVRFAARHLLTKLGQCDIGKSSPQEPEAYFGIRPEGYPEGHWAGKITERASTGLAASTDPLERAAWLRVLSELNAHSHAELALDRAGSGSALEAYIIVGACAAAELRKASELPDHYAPLISGLADRHGEIQESLNEGYWPWDEWLMPNILQLFTCLSDPALDEVSTACAALLSDAEPLVFHYDIVLFLILGSPAPRIPEEPCTLSKGRREIARVFLAKPKPHGNWWFWDKKNGNAGAACKRMGVPHDRKVWLRWLGLSNKWLDMLGL